MVQLHAHRKRYSACVIEDMKILAKLINKYKNRKYWERQEIPIVSRLCEFAMVPRVDITP